MILRQINARAVCRMNEKFKYCMKRSPVQDEEVRVHSTAAVESLTLSIFKLSSLHSHSENLLKNNYLLSKRPK